MFNGNRQQFQRGKHPSGIPVGSNPLAAAGVAPGQQPSASAIPQVSSFASYADGGNVEDKLPVKPVGMKVQRSQAQQPQAPQFGQVEDETEAGGYTGSTPGGTGAIQPEPENDMGALDTYNQSSPQRDPMTIRMQKALNDVNDVVMYNRKKYGLSDDKSGQQQTAQADTGSDDDQQTQAFAAGGSFQDDDEQYPANSPGIPAQEPMGEGEAALPQLSQGDTPSGPSYYNQDNEQPSVFESAFGDKNPAAGPKVGLGAVGGAIAGAAKGIMDAGPNAQAAGERYIAYLSGRDAATSAETKDEQNQVSQGGQVSPDQAKVLAISKVKQEQGPDAAARHLVRYRTEFEAFQNIAAAALNGTAKKPADIQRAAAEATRAFGSMVDGDSVQFTPSAGGVTATIVTPTSMDNTGKVTPTTVQLTLDQFNNAIHGKQAFYDNIHSLGSAKYLQSMASTPGQPLEGQGKGNMGQGSATGQFTNNQNATAPVTRENDKVFDPKIVEQAKRLYPAASQAEQQREYIAHNTQEAGKQASTEKVAQLRGPETAALRVAGSNDRAANIEAGKNDRQEKQLNHQQQMFMMKAAQDLLKQQNAEGGKNLRAAAQPGADMGEAMKQLKKYGITPPAGLFQDQAPQGPQAPQVQAPGAAQPTQTDIDYLKSNPNRRSLFDKRFGAGASARILGQ